MLIIHTYLTKEIAKYFFIVLASVICIYAAVDFFEKIDNFLRAGASLSKALIFFALKTPFIMAQVIPVCILLSILVAFGLMAKNNELVAIKSCGVSIYFFMKPILFIGVISSVVLFFFSEVIVPITMEKANRIWLQDVRKEAAMVSKEKNIWIKGSRMITHIAHYSPTRKTIFGVTLNHFDEDFRLVRRVDAEKGVFKEGRWVLSHLMEQVLNKTDGDYTVTFYEEKIEPLDFLPEDLKRVIKKSEEMNIKELLSYIRKIEAEGYGATSYRVDLHAKLAFPLVCLIMCIVATGISLRGNLKEGLPVSIAYGLGIAFLYWVFYSFCVSLGYGEMLPPVVAAWMANLIFICFGVVTLLNAE